MKRTDKHFNSVTWIAACLMLMQVTMIGCAPAKVREDAGFDSSDIVFNRAVDEYGRPAFIPLSDRPTGTGDKFSIVQFQDNRPISSYEIVIKNDGERNLSSPVSNLFKNLLTSIGLGLTLGSLLFLETEDNKEENQDDWPDDLDSSDAFTVGFVIGTGAGLVYSAYNLGKDVGGLVLNKHEILMSETYYNYDISGRLTSFTTMPAAGQDGRTLNTRFSYREDERIPYHTETTP